MSILFTLDDFTKVEKVTMPWAGETYFIPAGTPMSADGIANDGNAIGILAENARLEYEYDYGTNPYGKVDYTYSVITHGYVNTEDAEASFGGTYSDECRSALSNIVFCDNHKIGGGGGGGMMVVNLLGVEEENYSVDKTLAEIDAALPNVVMYDGYNGYVYHCDGWLFEGITFSRFDPQYEDDGTVAFIHCTSFDVLDDNSVVKYFGRK